MPCLLSFYRDSATSWPEPACPSLVSSALVAWNFFDAARFSPFSDQVGVKVSSVLNAPVLVLNRNYQPVRVTTARHAFTMMFVGRARALDTDFEPFAFEDWIGLPPSEKDEVVGTTKGPVRVPRILLLGRYNRVPKVALRLSRRNIFLRDDYTCQYCHERLPVRELNLDHVMPRSRGGGASWENLVTSCRECNLRKGRLTPEESGMPLMRAPRKPAWTAVAQMVATTRRYDEWEPFLATVRFHRRREPAP